jgi:hypothetical protein
MGTVSFYNGYTHNNANLILKGGNVSFINPLTINGGNIEGNGNINATITNSGLLNPRYASNTEFGRLTINGNYTETNNASINIQLGGSTAGTNFDQVDINGNATFDGTLNVSLLNNFTPTLGSTYDVLTYENFTGSLDFTGLKIADKLTLIPVFNSKVLTLIVGNATPKANNDFISTNEDNILENERKIENRVNEVSSSIKNLIVKKEDNLPQPSRSDSQHHGFCYVGRSNNIRHCAKVSSKSKCMSGDIFPTMDLCINPAIR